MSRQPIDRAEWQDRIESMASVGDVVSLASAAQRELERRMWGEAVYRMTTEDLLWLAMIVHRDAGDRLAHAKVGHVVDSTLPTEEERKMRRAWERLVRIFWRTYGRDR